MLPTNWVVATESLQQPSLIYSLSDPWNSIFYSLWLVLMAGPSKQRQNVTSLHHSHSSHPAPSHCHLPPGWRSGPPPPSPLLLPLSVYSQNRDHSVSLKTNMKACDTSPQNPPMLLISEWVPWDLCPMISLTPPLASPRPTVIQTPAPKHTRHMPA